MAWLAGAWRLMGQNRSTTSPAVAAQRLNIVIGRIFGLSEKSAATRRVGRPHAAEAAISLEMTLFWTQFYGGRIMVELG